MSKPKAVIGVDPGTRGAGVIITQDRKIFEWCEFKKVSTTHQFNWFFWNATHYECSVAVEFESAWADDYRDRLATFMRSVGRTEACILIAGLEIEKDIYSQTWQKEFGLGSIEPSERKRRHKEKAQQLFPQIKVTLDLADAILIAEYMWRLKFGTMLHEKGRKKNDKRIGHSA